VKAIRSDNGPEFLMTDFFNSKGILHQTSCVETPQQNSVVERKHGHILNVCCSLMFHSHIPKTYWCFAVNHVVHLINRLPSPILQDKTPFELLYNEPPTYANLKVFGSLCFSSTLYNSRSKLDARARKCVFLGFKTGTKGFLVLDFETRSISVSHNVVFMKTFSLLELSNRAMLTRFLLLIFTTPTTLSFFMMIWPWSFPLLQ
jgi:hypothetical protein